MSGKLLRWGIATVILLHSVIAFAGQGIRQIDVFTSGTHGYHTYRIPAIVATPSGALLAFSEGRKNSSSDTGDIDMLVKRSMDGGRTWGEQKVIWDDGPNTCGNPTPVIDRTTGTIWLLLTHNLGQDSEGAISTRKSKGTRTVWISRSDDDGVNWSKPVEITQTTKRPEWGWYATGPGVGIQLEHGPHKGRLLIPCTYSVQPDAGQPDKYQYGDHVIYSDDHGNTWKLGGIVPWLDVDEAQVAELSDDSIMMNMRSDEKVGRRVVGFSVDGGGTWGKMRRDEALIEPPCQASILRYTKRLTHAKNRLLFSNPASYKERVRMTVRLSYDEGTTWPVSRELHSGPSAYSCLTVLPDMTIGCLYERGDKDAYEKITFASFTLEWLTNGADRLTKAKDRGQR
jgi:sialidase-1